MFKYFSIWNLSTNKYTDKIFSLPGFLTIAYIACTIVLSLTLQADKKFPAQAQENMSRYSCNLKMEQISFYQEKIALIEKQVNNISNLDALLIIPYIYKMSFKKIDTASVLVSPSVITINSDAVVQKRYSATDLISLINKNWRETYSYYSFKKCDDN